MLWLCREYSNSVAWPWPRLMRTWEVSALMNLAGKLFSQPSSPEWPPCPFFFFFCSPLQGKQSPFGEETLAEHRAQHCVLPLDINKTRSCFLPFATSLINTRISALPATQKNKVDLFLFFQLWLIIKCEPCTKLSSVLGLCCHETSDSKYREMGAHRRCCRGIFYTARVSMGQGTALFKDSGLLWQVAAGTSFSMWHREFKMIYKSETTACLGHF